MGRFQDHPHHSNPRFAYGMPYSRRDHLPFVGAELEYRPAGSATYLQWRRWRTTPNVYTINEFVTLWQYNLIQCVQQIMFIDVWYRYIDKYCSIPFVTAFCMSATNLPVVAHLPAVVHHIWKHLPALLTRSTRLCFCPLLQRSARTSRPTIVPNQTEDWSRRPLS